MTDDLLSLLRRSIEQIEWRKRVAEAVKRGAERCRPIRVTPKAKRISGPHTPELVDDGPGPQDACERSDWHTLAGQADLPPAVFGPKCAECRLEVFAGEATLLPPRGLCAKCFAHSQGNHMSPLVGHDEPPAAA